MTEEFTKEDYKEIEKEEFLQARRLSELLIQTVNPVRVVDFGCATGLYLFPYWKYGRKVQGTGTCQRSNKVHDR